jgi:hypothetical protein
LQQRAEGSKQKAGITKQQADGRKQKAGITKQQADSRGWKPTDDAFDHFSLEFFKVTV